MKNSWKLFLVIAIISSFAFIPRNEPKKITIVIDAAHGGVDFGASYDSHLEKNIVDQITKKIKAQNTDANIVIHLTRSRDESVSLSDRSTFSNNIQPDLLLSLHVNASKNKATSGIELFVPKEGAFAQSSNEIALRLGSKLSENLNLKVHNVKEGQFYILKKSTAPAIIVELGYLTNDADRQYLTTEREQDRFAATILEFINDLK